MTTQQVVGWSCVALTPVCLGFWAYFIIRLYTMDLDDDD